MCYNSKVAEASSFSVSTELCLDDRRFLSRDANVGEKLSLVMSHFDALLFMP